MKFSSAISTAPDAETACADVAAQLREALGEGAIDLCVVFASAQLGDVERTAGLLQAALDPGCMVGCTGGGIIGGGLEVEDQSALSVTAARMPGVALTTRHLEDIDLPDPDAPPSAWVDVIGSPPAETRGIVALPEPFSFAADRLLAGLDFAYPGTPVVGGLASGMQMAGNHCLFIDGRAHRTGAVLLALGGEVAVETRVAQGCKPFGKVGRITEAHDHDLLRIDGRPAGIFLQEQLDELTGREKHLARTAPIFLGIAMDPFATDTPGHGDFLIRHVMGYDPSNHGLRIGELLSVGRAVQFHLRDEHTSAEDLRTVLEEGQRRPGAVRPAGALLFSCLGRGRHLYGEEGHDSSVFAEIVGPVPLGGFFCNGEIGPVQGTTHLHGYTSAFALFGEPAK